MYPGYHIYEQTFSLEGYFFNKDRKASCGTSTDPTCFNPNLRFTSIGDPILRMRIWYLLF